MIAELHPGLGSSLQSTTLWMYACGSTLLNSSRNAIFRMILGDAHDAEILVEASRGALGIGALCYPSLAGEVTSDVSSRSTGHLSRFRLFYQIKSRITGCDTVQRQPTPPLRNCRAMEPSLAQDP